MITLEEIRALLATCRPAQAPPGIRTWSAVALLLREGEAGPEILFIERARRQGDPWSGDLGFPGGKVEPWDGGARRAAERETREEIGLDLAVAEYLGHLENLTGAHLPVLISCFVYNLLSPPPLVLNEEVTEAFWFPLGDLLDPARHRQATVRFRNETLVRPAIDLLGPGRTVLWGITYRLVTRFLQVLGCGGHLTPDVGNH